MSPMVSGIGPVNPLLEISLQTGETPMKRLKTRATMFPISQHLHLLLANRSLLCSNHLLTDTVEEQHEGLTAWLR